MRFLADMDVSITTVEALRAADHDAVHLRDQGLIRHSDQEIVEMAARERRIVLTFDLDFGDILAAARSEAPSVVIFRLPQSNTCRRESTPLSGDCRL